MSGIVVAAVIGTAKLYGLWVIYEHIISPITQQAGTLLLNTVEDLFQRRFSFKFLCTVGEAKNEGEEEE